jgi:hypothetical protein
VTGETTVKTHVAHVLLKLDLRDRVQGVVLAYESGLIEPGETSPSLWDRKPGEQRSLRLAPEMGV